MTHPPAWHQMERQVFALLFSQAILEDPVTVSANERAIEAELDDEAGPLRARIEEEGWYEPETVERATETANQLAQALYVQWRNRHPI